MQVLRAAVWIAIVAYLILFVWNTTTRTGRFSPDSMNYVNVGRDIAAGKGITQPSLGFNQPKISADDNVPAPFIAQPPLYPLLIAFVSRLGLSAPLAALLISAVGFGVGLVLAYLLAIALYDESVGLFAIACLLFYQPFRYASGFAWSESIGIAFMLLSLWLLTRAPESENRYVALAAGLCGGFAFATRYAFFPLIAVGSFFLFLNDRFSRRMTSVVLYVGGFLVPAALVWWHNLTSSSSLMPPMHRASANLGEVVITALESIFGRYVVLLKPSIEIGLLVFSLVTCALLFAKHGVGRKFTELLVSDKRYVLSLWASAYLAFIIVERSAWFYGSDRANEMLRMIAPAGVVLVISWCAFIVKATTVPRWFVKTLVLVGVSFSLWNQTRVAVGKPQTDYSRPISDSPRLSWIGNYTSNSDLIVGEDNVDIPFFFPGRLTVTFLPHPVTQYGTYEVIRSYANRHCDSYRNFYIVLGSHDLTEQEWRDTYGDFFADLVYYLHLEKYADVEPVAQLADGSVFRIRCHSN